MLGQPYAVDAKPRPHSVASPEPVCAQSNILPALARWIGLVSLGLTLFILGVMAVARLQPVPRLLDLPQAYRPGSAPPQDLSCHSHLEDAHSRWYEVYCSVRFQGHEVHFEFDNDYRVIARSIIPVQDYRLGQLMVSWGAPSGVIWNHYTIYIYWSSRWVILDADSFRPDSPVKYVMYKPEQTNGASWQGFRRPNPS